jgi:hypothetical protein
MLLEAWQRQQQQSQLMQLMQLTSRVMPMKGLGRLRNDS